MRVRLAWSLFALTVLVAAVHVALLVASRRPVFGTDVVADGFPLVTVGAIAGAFVGAVIVARYPAHPIGWLFVVGQLLSELGLALRAYGYSALSGELGSAPGGHLAIWFSLQTGGLFVIALLAVLFLLAPDGRLASRRWAWALAAPVIGLLVSTAAVGTVMPDQLDRHAELVGREPGPVLVAVLSSASLLIGVGVMAAAVSLLLRLRRAHGDERTQLRWMTVAAVVLAAGVVGNVILVAGSAPEWILPLPVMVAYVCVPLFTGIAILRYRLYHIDIFINRAITLAALSGFVTVGYIALVVLIGELFPLTRGLFWPSLLATALVALAFQPVRKKAERLADRLVYGARAAPYVELAEFSKRLQESPDTDELLRRVAESVARAVGARGVSIRVDVPGRASSEVSWPDGRSAGSGPAALLPVIDGEGRLGSLSLTLPAGAGLRPDEQRLVDDFVLQLGRALRNIRLESALIDRVSQLRRSTDELAASARRLDQAQIAARQRFEANLARTVLPHLQRVGEGLDGLINDPRAQPASSPDQTGRHVDELTVHTQTALESLRSLTRGVFPTQLARRGLAPALAGYLERSGHGSLAADPSTDRRFDPRVESTAYFCAVELIGEIGGPANVRLSVRNDVLALEIHGPAGPIGPPSTDHLQDRAAALSGTLESTVRDRRVRLELLLPLSSPGGVPDVVEAAGVEVGLGDVGRSTAP